MFTNVAHVQAIKKKYQPMMPFVPQISVTSHNSSHTFNFASFIGVEGEHYEDHRQHTRVQHESVYGIHTPEILYCLITTTLSTVVISAAKHIT